MVCLREQCTGSHSTYEEIQTTLKVDIIDPITSDWLVLFIDPHYGHKGAVSRYVAVQGHVVIICGSCSGFNEVRYTWRTLKTTKD